MSESRPTEPWLRGKLTDLPAVHRAVIHALQLAEEDLTRWCADFTREDLNARPAGVTSVAFHIRHIGRSVDRLLTYAEGHPLSETQLSELQSEIEPVADQNFALQELKIALARAIERVRQLSSIALEENRTVGRKMLPTSVGGLLVHIAEHTQRHVGQAITTAKIVRSAHGG
jgi:uncharacterized damage-inducible protein DinB